MKIHNIMIWSILMILAFTIVSGQDQIPYRSTADLPQQVGKFEQSILNKNRFKMNQSFSLSTSMGGHMSQTTGIYFVRMESGGFVQTKKVMLLK